MRERSERIGLVIVSRSSTMSSAAMYGLATWFVVLGLGQVVAGYQPLGQITVGLGVVTACANFWIDHWRRF